MATPDLVSQLRRAGVVETHYHIGPELLPRRYDVAALAECAREWGATIVLKNHTYPTTPLAALARAHYGVRFLGSVVLNRFVGGLNPDAVLGAVSGNRANVSDGDGEHPPVVVWMPTVHARAHLDVLGRAFDPRWSGAAVADPAPREAPVDAFDDGGRPRPELLDVLSAIAATRSILATGHLPAREVMRLVPLALEAGVKRVIVTHPHYPCVALSDAQLKALLRPEVFIEHCFAVHTIERVPLEALAASIRATGPEQVVLSTDFGQVCSEPFPEGTVRYAKAIEAALGGTVSQSDLVRMFSVNGRRALTL